MYDLLRLVTENNKKFARENLKGCVLEGEIGIGEQRKQREWEGREEEKCESVSLWQRQVARRM